MIYLILLLIVVVLLLLLLLFRHDGFSDERCTSGLKNNNNK